MIRDTQRSASERLLRDRARSNWNDEFGSDAERALPGRRPTFVYGVKVKLSWVLRPAIPTLLSVKVVHEGNVVARRGDDPCGETVAVSVGQTVRTMQEQH